MTTRAYSELYLSDAAKILSEAFDYAINQCAQECDFFARIFAHSKAAREFERGNPSVLSGQSGVELARLLLSHVHQERVEFPAPIYAEEKSPEYWAGWALAHYQWHTKARFKDVFACVSLSEIVAMYPKFHEMDLSRFFEALDAKCHAVKGPTQLKLLRERKGMSQAELAELSGVSLRSIQLYEQRVNGINKAQARTLHQLAHMLGCDMEDLLDTRCAG